MKPELSVIVPTLNEASALPKLLEDLAAQEGVTFELIASDGGSSDETCRLLEERAGSSSFPLIRIRSPRGRGVQLNAGARAARADHLLFLHADSRLAETHLLARALAATPPGTAGHFGLAFGARGFFYHFFSAKTFTGRPGTINGDQGLLISRELFEAVGGFDESLPFMEDARFERRLRERAKWVLLPGTLTTSPRRFEEEGRGRRQLVNVLIRLCDRCGAPGFLRDAPGIYRAGKPGGKLRLYPFFNAARRAIREGNRFAFWWEAGGYSLENFWQLPFLLDCRAAFAGGLAPSEVKPRLTNALERVGAPLRLKVFLKAPAALLTFATFYCVMLASLVFDGEG